MGLKRKTLKLLLRLLWIINGSMAESSDNEPDRANALKLNQQTK